MNNKQKQLFSHSSSIQKMFFEIIGDTECHIDVKYNEFSLILTFIGVGIFSWRFLEPLSNYCIDKNLSWGISASESGYLSIVLCVNED